MRENLKDVCATCKHAVSAEGVGEDMFFCDQLLGPLCEYADCSAPARVLVTGSEVGCADHYERDTRSYATLWCEEDGCWNGDEDDEALPLMFWGEICGEMDRYEL